MATYTKLLYHVVFSTKDRRPSISPDLRDELYPYIGGIVRNTRGVLLEIGGVADHVHLLMSLSADRSIADAVRDIKANSSKWAGERHDSARWFGWQGGYGAFTVSGSQVDTVRKYIENQERHHAKSSFKEEFVALLKRHGVEYDERYLWE